MIRRPRLSVLFGIAIVACFPIERLPRAAAEPPPHNVDEGAQGLIRQTGMAHFRLVLGRLELDPPRHRKGTKTAEREHPFTIQETLTVSSRRGVPSLHYTFETDQHHAIVDVVDAQTVQLISHRLDRRERVTLSQPACGPLTIEWVTADNKRSFQTASLLHLRTSHPAIFDAHLERLLPYLLEGPSLATVSAAAESQLIGVCLERPAPTIEEVRECLDRMRAPRSTTRSAAEAELLSWGLPVMRHLDQIDLNLLDAEQRARVQRVRWALQPQQPDTPGRLASWLSTDRDYWSLMAVRLPPNERLAADRFVTRVCGQGLEAARQADTTVRIAEATSSANR